MRIVLLSSDLMLFSSAQGAADRHDVQLIAAGNADAAVNACGEPEAQMLAIDLRLPGLDVGSVVAAVRGSRAAAIHILACGPHVHERSLAAAVAAGCDEVVTRGEFDRRLDAAVAKLST